MGKDKPAMGVTLNFVRLTGEDIPTRETVAELCATGTEDNILTMMRAGDHGAPATLEIGVSLSSEQARHLRALLVMHHTLVAELSPEERDAMWVQLWCSFIADSLGASARAVYQRVSDDVGEDDDAAT